MMFTTNGIMNAGTNIKIGMDIHVEPGGQFSAGENIYLFGEHIVNDGTMTSKHYFIAPNVTDYSGKGHITADVAFVHEHALSAMKPYLHTKEIVTIPYHHDYWNTSQIDDYVDHWIAAHPQYDY